MRLMSPGVTPAMMRDLALGLRRSQHHHALAEFLLQVVDQRAQLPALELIGAERHQLHALHFDGARQRFVQRRRRPTSCASLRARGAASSARLPARRTLRGSPRKDCRSEATNCAATCANSKSRRKVSSEPNPLMASMRRTPEETDSSPTILNKPISPVAAVCVPPQSSVEKPSESLHHAHLVAVLFAEERHGVVLVHGHVDGHVFEGFDLGVGQNFAVHDVFDLLEFLIGNLSKVRKIEAQPVGMHRRTGLLHVRAQHLAQRRVQQVRAGVVAADGVAAVAIDFACSRGRPRRGPA